MVTSACPNPHPLALCTSPLAASCFSAQAARLTDGLRPAAVAGSEAGLVGAACLALYPPPISNVPGEHLVPTFSADDAPAETEPKAGKRQKL